MNAHAIIYSPRTKFCVQFLWITYSIARVVAVAQYSNSRWAVAEHLIAALLLCLLTSLEHSRALRPSNTITGYLLIVLLSDVTEAIELSTVTCLSLATLASEVALLSVETRPKAAILKTEYRHLPPETLTGAFGNVLFPWITSLLFDKRDKRLVPQDLPPLDADCSSIYLRARIKDKWTARGRAKRYAWF